MIFGLQYLRGIAALMVVLIHAKVAVNHFVPSTRFILPDQGFVQFGKYGVDIFFVISGMVMYMTIGKCMRSDRGIGDFIIKRLIRVAPAFWMSLVLYAIALMVTGKMPEDAFRKFLTSAMFLFYPSEAGKAETIYAISWTLNFEVYFYMSLALMCCIFGKYGRVATGILFCAYTFLFYNWGSLNFIQRLIFSPIHLEFIFGMICGYAYQKKILQNIKLSVLCLIVGLFLIIGTNEWGVGDERIIYVGVPSLLCVLGAMNISFSEKTITHKILMKLGDASYSVYLIHTISFIVLSTFLRYIDYKLTTYTETIVLYIGMISFALITSIIFSIYFEKSAIKLLTNVVFKRRKIEGSLAQQKAN